LKLRDPELRKRICGYVRYGETFAVACAGAGICKSTFSRWQALGCDAKRKQEKGERLTRTERLFLAFLDALEQAKSEGRLAMANQIFRAALDNDWRAASFLLERRHPETWGRTDRVLSQVTGAGGGPLEMRAEVPVLPMVRERVAFAWREKLKREVRRELRDGARAKAAAAVAAKATEPKPSQPAISPPVESVEPPEPPTRSDLLM